MEVETYEVTEATTEGRDSFEVEAEAQAMIEELGLEGQKSLLRQTDTGVDTAERIPYQKMNQEERRVYSVLFPETASLEQYDAGPIPLRVLQVASHALKLFDEVEVWYPQTSHPDPVLVGLTEPGVNQFTKQHYLLARWGDALAPFDELRREAARKVREGWEKKARSVIGKCEAFLANPDHDVDRYIGGDNLYEPYTA